MRHAPMTTPWLVNQALYTLLQKPLRPFIDKAAADPDRGSNVGDRYAIGQE